jgi:transforming growth factor-beta-induced protein
MKQTQSITLSLLASCALLSAGNTPKLDIVDTAVSAGSFKTLAAALKSADLIDALKGDGPFTVFAPTDEAFAKLPKGTVEKLLKPENKQQLVDILTYHVVSGNVPAAIAVNLNKATALNKKEIDVKLSRSGLFLNGSKVVKTDINCRNGVIHVIDAVLLPPKTMTKQSATRHSARNLVHMAIDRGVPMFNHGNHQACAAIYEITAHALMAMPEQAVSSAVRKMLDRAIAMAGRSHDSTSKAWAFRSAFDGMMAVR